MSLLPLKRKTTPAGATASAGSGASSDGPAGEAATASLPLVRRECFIGTLHGARSGTSNSNSHRKPPLLPAVYASCVMQRRCCKTWTTT